MVMVWGLHFCPGDMALENNDFLPYLLHREKDHMMMMNLIYPIIFGVRGLNTKNSQTTFYLINIELKQALERKNVYKYNYNVNQLHRKGKRDLWLLVCFCFCCWWIHSKVYQWCRKWTLPKNGFSDFCRLLSCAG